MLCGKIAAGKSSLAARLMEQDAAVLISEDAWLAALFSDQMATGADYVRCSTKLQGIMRPHVADLLNAGVSVVLDYAANTVATRVWMRGILEATQADHQMHVLDVPDAVCLMRLKHRNAAGDHPFAATEAQFHRFTQHYVPPTADEGFTIVRHTAT
ncbi:MAG: ATP-binding protein [Pseudomonadota bacterium]